MRTLIFMLLTFGVMGAPAVANAETCKPLIDHGDITGDNPWQTVNDGVMGGRSLGGSILDAGVLSFSGVTNTNGGGFSSIRMQVPRGTLSGATRLRVQMQRDARDYAVTLRTNVRSYGRRIAFRAPISDAPVGAWGVGTVVFDQLKASIWGRPIRDAVFDPSEVVEIGLIIYDGKDGPFSMQVQRIDMCSGGPSQTV